MESGDLFLVPWPKSLAVEAGRLELGKDARIMAQDERLRPLAQVLSDELIAVAGLRLPIADGPGRPGDIGLRLQPTAVEGELDRYEVEISDQATVAGNTLEAVAQGTTTLLQAVRVADGRASLPCMTVHDGPRFPYCGAMLDVARKPYSIETLRQCVIVCRYYKIRYLHLHLSDENAWTFPSRKFPQLGSQNFAWAGGEKPAVYSREELLDLVAFADERGVTLVPEMEVPGHSGQLRGTLPEIFGYRDAEGKITSPGVINMASDESYAALDALVGEMCDVFHSSPYFHLGCDEASLGGIEDLPEVRQFAERQKLPYPHAIFNTFVRRMDAIVAKHGKRTIVWEGAPTGPEPLPKDIIFMPWVGQSAAAADLVRAGHAVINAPWGVDQPYFDPFRVNAAALSRDEPLLLGATSLLWESPSDQAVPYLRTTGALRNEPTYDPDSGRDLAGFCRRLRRTDPRLDRLLCGFSWTVQGLVDRPLDPSLAPLFDRSVTLTLDPPLPAEQVRYTLDGSEPEADSPAYSGPITLRATTLLKARWFPPVRPPGATFVRQFTRLPAVPHAAVGAKVAISPDRPGYFGPGPEGLTDGFLAAGYDYSQPGWVGWLNDGQPLTVTLDLGRPTELSRVSSHFLRSAGGVAMPQQVEISLSQEGQAFTLAATVRAEYGMGHRGWFDAQFNKQTARYVRVAPTAGGDWTFLDEVAVDPSPPPPSLRHAALGKPAVLAQPPTAYTAPGVAGLTDGYVSDVPNFLGLEWLGFEGHNLEATLDLGEAIDVRSVAAEFLQDVRAGIFVPARLEVFASDDGQDFRLVGSVEHEPNDVARYKATLSVDVPNVRARWLRILAHTAGQWLFVDEVFVNPDSEDDR